MKKLLLIVACVATLGLASCTGVSYLNNTVQTDVVLSQNNYRILDKVEGTSESTYVLGFGGCSEKSLKDNAVNDMFQKANLKDGQAIANITYTTSVKTILGIYTEMTVTAHGNIIEFTR